MLINFIFISTLIAIFCLPAIWFLFNNPRFLKDVADCHDELKISIIIPARNQQHNIIYLLESLQKQTSPPLEIIVVDDNSSDNTAILAEAYGATVISGKPLPTDENWKSKPWACQQGSEAATGDWLLFLDTHTTFLSSTLTKLKGAIKDTQSEHVISVSPYHRIEYLYEELSAFFNLLMVTGANSFIDKKSNKGGSALFDQCLLISKNHYDQVGGHTAVKEHSLENFHLAEKLEHHNIKRTCYLGQRSIYIRMFPMGFKELWQGWSSRSAKAAPRALALSSAWITGAMFISCVSVVASIAYAYGLLWHVENIKVTMFSIYIIYLIYAIQCFIYFRKTGSFSAINAILFPISLLFYQILFFTALISKKRGQSTS